MSNINISGINTSYAPLSIDGLSSYVDVSSIIYNGSTIDLSHYFNKLTDNTDDITEGSINKFDHITVSSPLTRTLDVIACNPVSSVQSGYLTNTDYNTFVLKASLWNLNGTNIENNVSYTPNFITAIKVSGNTLSDASRNISALSLNINSTQAIDSSRVGYLTGLWISGNLLSDASRNITCVNITNTGYINTTGNINTNMGAYRMGGFDVITPTLYAYLQRIYINNTLCIDSSRNITALSVNSTSTINSNTRYQLGGFDVIDSGYNFYTNKIFNTYASTKEMINIACNGSNDAWKDIYIGNTETNTYSNTGSRNIFIGRNSGNTYRSTGSTASYNVCVGTESGYYTNSNAQNNTCLGYQAGRDLDTMNSSVNIGAQSAYSAYNSTGSIHIGYQAGYSALSSNFNVKIGFQSGWNSPSSAYNVLVGYRSGYSFQGSTCNVILGAEALSSQTYNSDHNTIIGYYACNGTNTTGFTQNIVLGSFAYRYGKSPYNMAIGYLALTSHNQLGKSQNVAVGNYALYSGIGCEKNTAVGYEAGYSNNDAYCTFVGYKAGYGNNNGANTAVGYMSGHDSTGLYNTFLGYQAGYYANGSYKTLIGSSCQSVSNYTVGVGYASNPSETGSTALGYSTICGSTYQVCLGYNVSSSQASDNQAYGYYLQTAIAPITGGSWWYLGMTTGGRMGPITSSKKYKKNIKTLGEEKIDSIQTVLKLKPVVYTGVTDASESRDIGFIAEEVNEVLPNVVPKHHETGEPCTVHYDRIVPVLVDCIQNMITYCNKLEERIAILERKK